MELFGLYLSVSATECSCGV